MKCGRHIQPAGRFPGAYCLRAVPGYPLQWLMPAAFAGSVPPPGGRRHFHFYPSRGRPPVFTRRCLLTGVRRRPLLHLTI
ncbi:MAG: hypothetical protein CSA76_02880 [Spirochaetales bacterium]|nr:MAG: hypothetical protein CSA76_02880 [Spirochaetales bacterium]